MTVRPWFVLFCLKVEPAAEAEVLLKAKDGATTAPVEPAENAGEEAAGAKEGDATKEGAAGKEGEAAKEAEAAKVAAEGEKA